VDRLKPNAVGLGGVLFMVIATAAPITAATGNIPFSVGFGNGIGTPASYIVVMLTLGLFSVGYVAMAREITAAGAFYGFITAGLGRVAGMASGMLALVGYIAFEAVLVSAFAAFGRIPLEEQLGITVPWSVLAGIVLLGVTALSYFDLGVAARVLGVLLICEISILLLMAFAVLLHGGGPDGVPLEAVNPVNGLKGPAAGVGLVFAFFSWVGFESTAIYGEESKNPRRIVPRATILAVFGVGIFYIFVGWMAISGTGADQAVAVAQRDPFALFFGPTERYLGAWTVDVYQWLLCTGSFAAALAFHNCAARYSYAFGRDGFLPRSLGKTHPRHGSPYVASFMMAVATGLITLGFLADHQDPYLSQYALMGVIGTLAIVAVQVVCSVAVIGYFRGRRRTLRDWLETFVAPLLSGIAMIVVIVLLMDNLDTAAGVAASTLLFDLIPWIILAVFLAGGAMALYFRSQRPEKYTLIGRVIFKDETGDEERVELEPSFRSDPTKADPFR